MNALELIDTIRDDKPFSCDEVTAMLRKQHEAIRVLREALSVMVNKHKSVLDLSESPDVLRGMQALAATEKFNG